MDIFDIPPISFIFSIACVNQLKTPDMSINENAKIICKHWEMMNEKYNMDFFLKRCLEITNEEINKIRNENKLRSPIECSQLATNIIKDKTTALKNKLKRVNYEENYGSVDNLGEFINMRTEYYRNIYPHEPTRIHLKKTDVYIKNLLAEIVSCIILLEKKNIETKTKVETSYESDSE